MVGLDLSENSASESFIELARKQVLEQDEAMIESEDAFAYGKYAEKISRPIAVNFKSAVDSLDRILPRCLDMPIRLAGQSQYALPVEWEGLTSYVEEIVSIEEAVNPNWKDYNTYLTVDSKDVVECEQQRRGGLHVDGFQGERHQVKHKVTRNYVVTTNGGTVFYPQRFIVAEPSEFDVFKGFDLQADCEPFIAEENVPYFMDAYAVHESGFTARKGIRTFVRVTFDLKIFDRFGNTKNPNLDYDWLMIARTTQERLRAPHLTDILTSEYFPNPSLV